MEKSLRKRCTVATGLSAVWKVWTTAEGARRFFAPEARIEPEVGGAYELYFMPDAPEGTRGSEGCTVLEIEPESRLVVSWNFPPHLSIRGEHTRVELAFTAEGGSRTRVEMAQTGWQEGGDWDKGYEYFDRAWDLVLARLQHAFEHGPVDWSDPYVPEGPRPTQ